MFIENVRGTGSPSNAGKPLRSYFLSLHLLFVALLFLSFLTPSFSLSLPVIPGCGLRGYCALLQNRQGCVGSCCFFFSWVLLIFMSPFWGHPFPLPHTGNHLCERHCGWFSGWLPWNICSLPQYEWHGAVLLVAKTDRSKYSVCLTTSLLLWVRVELQQFIVILTLMAGVCLCTGTKCKQQRRFSTQYLAINIISQSQSVV